MKKKIIITVIVLCVIAGAAAGAIYGYHAYQMNTLTADVFPVANINWGYWGDETSSYGMVTNDLSQVIYQSDEQVVQEVLVEDGQTVEVGDPLVTYDITEAQMNLEMKKLEVQEISNNIAAAQRKLAELRNTTPIPEAPREPEPEPQPEPSPKPEKEKTGEAYHYISKSAKSYDKKADGSEEKPYRFLCAKDAFVYGSYLNYLRENKCFAVFEIRRGNVKKGALVSSWTVNGAALDEVEDDAMWSVSDRQQIEEEPLVEEEPETEMEEPSGYTAEELAGEIKQTEKELKDLDLDKRQAELELKSYEDACEDGTVCATVSGVVKLGGEEENDSSDSIYEDTENMYPASDILLSVAGSEGLYVKGDISELLLGKVEAGQEIYATSWDSGMTFTAKITEISKYPDSSPSFSSQGNQNVSYYPYTAYIEDTTGLKNGEYVDLSMQAGGTARGDEVICIDKAYVREENGRSYVYVADENDRLEKRYVTTGKMQDGNGIVIDSGLSLEDRIAFPYGKTAKEGIKVKDTDYM